MARAVFVGRWRGDTAMSSAFGPRSADREPGYRGVVVAAPDVDVAEVDVRVAAVVVGLRPPDIGPLAVRLAAAQVLLAVEVVGARVEDAGLGAGGGVRI